MDHSLSKPILLTVALMSLSWSSLGQGSLADYERADKARGRYLNKVYRSEVRPRWFRDGEAFWYRVQTSKTSFEFVAIECANPQSVPAFDHKKLGEKLASSAKEKIDAKNLPFQFIEIEGTRVRFNAFNRGWSYDRSSDELTEADKISEPRRTNSRRRGGRPSSGARTDPRSQSPDKQWRVLVKDHNVYLRDAKGKETQLSQDGTKEFPYDSRAYWSPDSGHVVVTRTKPGEEHLIHMVESSPKDQVQPKLHSMKYHKPGDKLAQTFPSLFRIEGRTKIEIKTDLFFNPWSIKRIRWDSDSKRFTFLYNQRGHQVLRVIVVDAETGEAGVLVDENSSTFIDYAYKSYTHFDESTSSLIWMSERSGWNHLYRIDSNTGSVKNSVTSGDWVVRNIVRADDQTQRIWFRASGLYPEQDPYYVHYCSVNYDGSDFRILTRGNGDHRVSFSPNHKWLVDTYSRVDMPAVSELRSSDTGKLVMTLETGDWDDLIATGWQVPERFVAKGRDGTTDIHGIIVRPSTYDPSKKYPIIESIYAGPHGSFVPKGFSSFHRVQSLVELGFILVQIDGMGTSNRSKAFHDVCCKNLGDSGFPDRMLWMKAAAKKYPSMDLKRVGIYGGSAGGQSALRALLAFGDFYKVAVSDCGCHDNRMDKVWWNELWMGWPIGKHYEEQSNVTCAHQLTGKLLLMVGELDRNVDPASTMQVVNALIKADKDFDLVVFPGGGHGSGSPYATRKRRDFFVRNLLGVEPRHQ